MNSSSPEHIPLTSHKEEKKRLSRFAHKSLGMSERFTKESLERSRLCHLGITKERKKDAVP